jgi:hypothetical protein
MTHISLSTMLLGRRVRLRKPPSEGRTWDGTIATVYHDGAGMHYVVLIQGTLVNVADGEEFTVLDEEDW